MKRSGAQFKASGPQYVEELFGVDPTGATDSTAAWLQALASGRTLRMFEGAVYRLTDELSFTTPGNRIVGDGSQTFKQYTANRGFFQPRLGADGFELQDVAVESIPDRSAGPGSTRYEGLNPFQRVCAVWAEADHIRVKNLQVKNTYTMVCLRGQNVTDSYTITDATQTNPVVLTLAEGTAGLTAGSQSRFAPITGVAGMTELNGRTGSFAILDATRVSIGIDGAAFSAYTGGGTFPAYDFSGQSEDIEIVNLRGDTVDMGVTAGQYDLLRIDGITMVNQTNYTDPPHAIYFNNANGHIGVSRATIKNVKGSNFPILQPWIKLSEIRDSVVESCESDGSSGFLWSNAHNCRQVACSAINLPNGGAIGTNITGASTKVQIIGGVMGCAPGTGAYGVLAEQTSQVVAIGVGYTTDYTGGSDLGSGFRTQDSASLKLIKVYGEHLQSNNDYLVGTSGTSQIEGSVQSNVGAPGLIRVGSGTTARLEYDRRQFPDYVFSSASVRIDDTGVLIGQQFGEGEPVLLGGSVAGAHSYGGVSNKYRWDRVGGLVSVYYSLRLTAVDAAMAGPIYIDCLPFIASGAGSAYAPYALPTNQCSDTEDMLGLPASGPGALMAEVIAGTTYIRVFYTTFDTTRVLKTYVDTPNFDNTAQIGGVIHYRTDEP